ncbi:unnamed protein product, partial [Coregonus sp. 'balchen']
PSSADSEFCSHQREIISSAELSTLCSSDLTDPPPPRLTVSSTVIRERDSVQLSCETPPSVSVSPKLTQQFIPDRWPMFIQVFLNRVRLFLPSRDRKSMAGLVVDGWSEPKPDITVHVNGDFNIICLIPGAVSPDTTCNLYVGEESQPSFTTKIKKRKAASASNQWFCQFSVSESDLVSGLQSVRRKEVSCDYRVSSEPNSLSPRSDGYRFTDLPQPSLTVIPAVIKERDSVQLNCQTAPSVSECYFKIEGQVEFTLPSPCQQTLTGTLLLRWTGQSSPAEVKIQCQYSATGSQFRSIYSEPSTITIQDHPQLTVSSAVIRERESVQLSCETPPSLHVSHCYFYIEGVKNLPDSSCTQTITGTELLKRAGSTIQAVVKVKCYYAIGKSHISPISDPVSVTVQGKLTVSSTVIRERDSVQLSCETPPSVSCSPKLTQQFIPDRWPTFIRVFLSRVRLFGSTRAGFVRLYLSRVRLFLPSRDRPRSTLPATTTVSPTEGVLVL